MSRRAFPVCAGVLALLGAVLGVVIEPSVGGLLPSAPQASPFVPRELPLAWRHHDPRPVVSHVLPVSMAEESDEDEGADEPASPTEEKADSGAQSEVKLAVPVAKPADKAKAGATPFVFAGIEPLEPPQPVNRKPGDLVLKGKTPFVTPEITPAELPPGAKPKAEPPVEEAPATAPNPAIVAAPAPIEERQPAVQPQQPEQVQQPQLAAEPEPMPEPEAGHAISEPLENSVPLVQAPPRTPEVVAAVTRASEKVRHGFELAERGALYSARAEFADALKLIAQGYDGQQTSRTYGKALAAGLAALKESADFVHQADSLQDASIANIAKPHVTPVLKDADVSSLTPMEAAQCYYTYAQEQLSAATAGEMCGSMALYGMGRVSVVVGKSGGKQLEHVGQAAALFRAALIAAPKNFRAANELGVLMAENGQLELARDLLVRSVSVSPQVTTWRNLAVVHKRSGQQNLAQHAEAQASAMQRSGHGAKNEPAVEWVDPATFATTKPASDNQPPAVAPARSEVPASGASAEAAKPQNPPTSVAKKGIAEWLGLSPRR